jgi:hypothetical protein
MDKEDSITAFDEGVKDEAQGFVGAVGESELGGLHAEVARQPTPRGFVLGIHGDLLARESGKGPADARRAPHRVFVAVQPEKTFAAFAEAVLGAHAENGAPRRNLSVRFFHETNTFRV